jgi:outer membrane protein OmpA-like peptidoglycan-associated protein
MTSVKSTFAIIMALLLTSCGMRTEQRFKESKLSNFTHDQTVEIVEQLASEDISQLNVKLARLNAKIELLESEVQLKDTSKCCETLEGEISKIESRYNENNSFEIVNSTMIFFDLNQFKLSASDKQELLLFKSRIDMASEFCHNYYINIYPFTDSLGNQDYNKKLRLLRGESIKECFVKDFGVKEDQINILTEKKYSQLPVNYYNRRALIEVDCQ